jgi:integrase/recombinase XerC
MTKLPFGGKAPKPLPWHPLPLMEDYLENLEIEERTPAYVRNVKLGLTHFGIFAQQEGIKHPAEIERPHILRFQAYLNTVTKENGDYLKLGTKQQQMKHLRAWIHWLLDTEVLTHDPWIRIRVGRTTKKPNPLEDDEIAQLFAAHQQQAFSISPFFYHRRETILTLLYGWGLRIHELQGLTVSGMDTRLDWVTAKNKGGGTKVLPYADEMKQITQRWLAQRATRAVPEVDSLLIDQFGNELTTHNLRKIVSELGQRAGVNVNPHRLRDSFGTALLDNDVPVERIMKMMGHTQRSQTLAYARVNDHKIKESHDAVVNPLIKKLLGGLPSDKPTHPADAD